VIRIDAGQIDVSDGGTPQRTVTGAKEVVSPSPRPRRRARRLFRWLLGIPALLVLLLVVTIQLILWSNYPRTYVLAQLQNQLGLRVEADVLSTTWRGKTRLTNVALSLPLGKDAFLRVPRMEVQHTSLIPLLLHRPLEVKAVALHDPMLVVQQDRSGQWDIAEVADLLGRVGGSQQAQASTGTPGPEATAAPASPAHIVLPAISLNHGAVRIVPWRSDPIEVRDIRVEGRPDGRLVWLYEIQAGDPSAGNSFATLKGEVAPGGAWRHRLRGSAHDLAPWLCPFVASWPTDAAASISWEGSLQNGAVTGVLDLESLHANKVDASGSMHVIASAEDIVLQPQTLTVHTPYPLLSKVVVVGGSIRATRQHVAIADVTFHEMGGAVALSGRYSFASADGSAQVAWANVQASPAATLTGEATVTLNRQQNGLPAGADQHLALHIISGRATTPAGVLEAAGDFAARGPDWHHLAWNTDLSHATWSGWPAIEFTRLTARGTVTPTHLHLAAVSAQGRGTINGYGDWSFTDNRWSANIHADDVPLLDHSGTAALALEANGDGETIQLQRATIRADGITAEASGSYRFTLPQPLDLAVALRETAFGGAPEADPATHPADAAAPDRSVRIQGKVRGNATLHGTITPLALDVSGRMMAQNLSVRGHDLGNLDADVAGVLTDHDLHLRTTDLDALGGHWRGAVAYPFAARSATLHIDLIDLPLANVSQALNWLGPTENGVPTPLLSGLASGEMTLQSSGFDFTAMRGTGSLSISQTKVQLPALGTPPLLADRAAARISLADGRIEIAPDVQQTAASPDTHGKLTGTLATTLNDPSNLGVNLQLQDWTLAFPQKEGVVRLSAQVKGDLDLRTFSGTAATETHTELWYHQRKIGDVRADANLAGRVLNVSRFQAEMLTGTLNGNARLDLDRLLTTTLSLTWHDVDIARLAPFHPLLEGAVGVYSGSVIVAPANEPRALEPLKLSATLTASGTGYRGIQIGNGFAIGYAGPSRLVLDRAALEIAGGRLAFWGRTVAHGGTWNTSQFRVAGESLDLNQIVQAVRPHSEEMVGRISGAVDILGDPRRPDTLAGGGALTIDRSDLANSDIIGGVYSVMHVGAAGPAAEGHGRITFRFEKGNAHITEMSYFNRGIQIRAAGNVKDVLDLPNSSIDIVLAGAARPLRDVRLPVVSDVDEIIAVLQSHVTTLRATGTLAEPHMQPVLLEQAGSDLREILLGEARNR
jgi:hypothetical protein